MILTGFPALIMAAVFAQVGSLGLERELALENPVSLASDFRVQGNPVRGASLFYSPGLLCSQCHLNGEKESSLGPDLSKLGKDATDSYLIESVLTPSKSIKKGYEPVTIATADGKSVTGLLVEDQADAIVLRTGGTSEKALTIAKKDIEQRTNDGPSLMPPKLVDNLPSRRDFLDLMSYLREIADKGPARARELRPTPSVLSIALPAYENELDHAAMIAELAPTNLQKGEAIYKRVCINCHGDKDRLGSMPTSLRFASGVFKNGSDPYSMYRTITHGFGQMPPQSWMVPEQKYDVIHYIRETFLRPSNLSQYVTVDQQYLAKLPKGTSRGPAPSTIEPWLTMDYGPSLMATLEVGTDATNFAYKGISVRLDAGTGGIARGHTWALYDHDTMRLAACWTGKEFIDWHGINFDGQHVIHPRIAGESRVSNLTGPGWANPKDGSFSDPRPLGRDSRAYGPLPREWAKYKGVYRYGDRVILSYSIGEASVLEMPGLEVIAEPKNAEVVTRTLEIGKSPNNLTMKLVNGDASIEVVCNNEVEIRKQGDATLLHIPAKSTPLSLVVLMGTGDPTALKTFAATVNPPPALASMTHGGASRWPEILQTQAELGKGDGPFQVDVLTHPAANPWNSRMRLSGFDFFTEGKRAAVCDWDGDVWLVAGLQDPTGKLSWRRIASGLFQPLGLKIVDGQIYVSCRDQIVILRDLNGDGETDFYDCFNDDHQVTEHFHEFAMGLQTDAAGNFYYAKAARHGKTALVPQHGTLLRVSKDGTRTDILATGFRAPNGVCVNEDGTFYVTDQEGFWNPKNRINLVKQGGFYGNMWGYHSVTDTSDAAMEQPLCWITNAMDRSPAELVRVPKGAWGPLGGSLLNLSYGYGKIFVVPNESINGVVQGGVSPLSIPQLATGIMRGRFHPQDHQLYACGLFGWAGNQEQPGGFYRIRYTGKPAFAVLGLEAHRNEMRITFSDPLDAKSVSAPGAFAVKTWKLKRSENYGSDHYDEASAEIRGAILSEDRRTVRLALPGLKPTWCMEIKYAVTGEAGQPVDGVIHNTIHRLQN